MFTQARGQKRSRDDESSEDSDEITVRGGSKKRKMGFMSSGGKGSSQVEREPSPEEEEDEDEGEDEIALPSARKKVKPIPDGAADEDKDEDQDEDEIVLPSARKKARPVPDKAPAVDDDSEDDMPTTLGTQKRRRKERESSFISSSPPAETAGSEDDLQIIDDPNRAPAQQDDSDDDEELAPVTPGKRRLQRRKPAFTQEEQDDLKEDLDFIGPSSDVDENRPPRDSQTLKKNARQQALERLKQARSSQPSLPDIQEDEDVAMQDQRELDEMYDNSEESPEPERVSRRAMFDADEDDEDFIEEGDDDVLGVPEGIPLKYTRYASMKAKDLWKFAIEWMVQKKINPAFAMDDEIYTLTFQKLDDEVSGLAGSKFMSSAWNAEFTSAVRSRPAIERDSPMGGGADFVHDKCDACNRGSHPATIEMQFTGKPYHRETLEEVGKDDDDDDEEDDSDDSEQSTGDHVVYDSRGLEVPPANRIWYLGRFCAQNARTAHALQHWRYHLYEWVVEWLHNQKYDTAKELKRRDKMSTKKRRKHANKIVDRMVDDGVVKKLWKEFRSTIDDAANAKQGRFEVGSP